MTAPIRVEVWSDVACPWCYIGKRKLEAGLATFAGDPSAPPVEVEFHSYELMPDMPEEFEGDAVDLLVRTKGLEERQVRAMQAQVTAVASEVGLAYDFASQQPTSTRKAHQLLHLAKEHGVQAEMKERLLAAHFVEGRHIGRVEELADLGAEVGLEPEEVRRILADETYLSDVRADVDQARRLGISSVPFFVIDGRYGVSGAQPAEVFARTLSDAVSEREGSAR